MIEITGDGTILFEAPFVKNEIQAKQWVAISYDKETSEMSFRFLEVSDGGEHTYPVEFLKDGSARLVPMKLEIVDGG